MVECTFVLRTNRHLHMSAIDITKNRRQLALVFTIGHGDASAGFLQQMTGRKAASRQPQHRHLSSRQLHLIKLHHAHHRSFNVLRLKSAKRIAMIQRRTTTFGSSHPFISKW